MSIVLKSIIFEQKSNRTHKIDSEINATNLHTKNKQNSQPNRSRSPDRKNAFISMQKRIQTMITSKCIHESNDPEMFNQTFVHKTIGNMIAMALPQYRGSK